jgi:hypothetical protein
MIGPEKGQGVVPGRMGTVACKQNLIRRLTAAVVNI